jgi:Putative DNA-binding domain
MSFSVTIEAFARALADPTRAPPTQTMGRESSPDARRFAVYRNNIAVAQIAALEARFPVTRRLVGDAFFRAMAQTFAARNKPRSAVILHYGVDFPVFIAGFQPARELLYLADVARVENAWVESYHSAEAEPLTLGMLAALDPTKLDDLRLAFHPAARLLRSDHPAASIWAGHQSDGAVTSPEHWRGEETLITRPDADVRVRVLPAGGYAFADALRGRATLGEAHAICDCEGFDPGSHLIGLIEAGAIAGLEI